MSLGIKLIGELKTKYQYDKNLADSLLKVISDNIKLELDSKTEITSEEKLEFKNSFLYFMAFNYTKSIFNASIDSGSITVKNVSGKLAIEYKVCFIKGLIALYLFIGTLIITLHSEMGVNLISFEILAVLLMPLFIVFFGLILSLRFLNVIFEKSLMNRYKYY